MLFSKRSRPQMALALPMLFVCAASICAQEREPAITRQEDVVYGRKFGTALTMDVFTPGENARGIGLVWVVSGGWFSSHEAVNAGFIKPFLDRGYTVFAVVHGSQPRYAIPDVLQDMHRAVRFIRYHAKDYSIDPDRIGIFGASAGGHLSLMQGVHPEPGNPDAKDPVDRESSRVRAVACFFPPTDFLNYGKEGERALGDGVLTDYKAPFDFQEIDPKTRRFVQITDAQRRLDIGKSISPVYHASNDDAPSLIHHGDADHLVPIQQAEVMIEALKKAGVEARLVVKPGAAHGWQDMGKDLIAFADWFDAHLSPDQDKKPSQANPGEPAAQPAAPPAARIVPRIEEPWWPIAANPDLGEYTAEGQQPVDFAIWRAADGSWQLASCIRKTKCGGKTRLLHRWEATNFSDKNWTPKGIFMEADPSVGETQGGLQAPHVIQHGGQWLMFYGDWQHIALAKSADGKTFERIKNRSGTVGLFDQGPGSNTRDPMVLPFGDSLLCYYTAYPDALGAVFFRKSEADLAHWSDPLKVAFGGEAGTNPYSAECPFVVNLDGTFYLFRTQHYGEKAQTKVYASPSPIDFGINDDSHLLATLPIAAPEIFQHEGQWYIAALNPRLDGIRLARLEWSSQNPSEEPAEHETPSTGAPATATATAP